MLSCSVLCSPSCHSALAVSCCPIFDCLSFEMTGLCWPVGLLGFDLGPSNVERQIQENSNYFVILALRMMPKSKSLEILFKLKSKKNNGTYRIQLFEKIFILGDNSSSITVQFGEYCCQSKNFIKITNPRTKRILNKIRVKNFTYSSCACSCFRISSRIFFCEFLANRMSSPILGLSTLK